MRVLFDCRYVRIDRHDGISRYSARLVESLARLHPVEMLISDERQLRMLPELPWHLAPSPTSPREPWLARRVNRIGPDVAFSPMQTMGSRGRDYALVLTLHDLIYYAHPTPPRELPWPIRLGWRAFHLAKWPQRMLLDAADEVVTVSATSRALIRRHRLTRREVTVVSNAADPVTTQATSGAERAGAESRELVYMGSFMPYKNVETLARAMNLLPGYRLHLMSRIPAASRSTLQSLAPVGSLVIHDGASDEEYASTLAGAHALVSASRDEGFGIPLVEAMSVGVPVVVSDIPIFREIGADAAILVDQENPEAVARGILTLADAQLWAARSDAALARARDFDWDASAAALLEVLERAARTRRR